MMKLVRLVLLEIRWMRTWLFRVACLTLALLLALCGCATSGEEAVKSIGGKAPIACIDTIGPDANYQHFTTCRDVMNVVYVCIAGAHPTCVPVPRVMVAWSSWVLPEVPQVVRP